MLDSNALRRLFSFQGRSSRKTYWLTVLLILGVYLVGAVIVGLFEAAFEPQEPPAALLWPCAALGLCLLISAVWVSVANNVKRWHDRNKPGWMVLVGFIPMIGSIWVFVECGCLEGTSGPNDYGDDPRW